MKQVECNQTQTPDFKVVKIKNALDGAVLVTYDPQNGLVNISHHFIYNIHDKLTIHN
jgi:prephenate dehydratase